MSALPDQSALVRTGTVSFSAGKRTLDDIGYVCDMGLIRTDQG